MIAGRIRHWDRLARFPSANARYSYVSDGAIDRWASHAEAVLQGEAWSDDCDGLASTVLDLLGRDGLAPADRWMLEVSALGGNTPNHLVGLARDSADAFWIVGDTFDAAYPAGGCRHTIIQHVRLDRVKAGEARPWRMGAPFLRKVARA